MPEPRARVSDDELQQLKDRVTLSQLIAGTVAIRLIADGVEYRALCPLHQEKTPSFTINDAKQFFHCFGCNSHGDHYDWLDEMRGLSLGEAKQFLRDWTGASAQIIPYPKATPAAAPQPVALWSPISPVPADAAALFDADGNALVYNPKRAGTPREWFRSRPAHVAAYRNSSGALIGYVLRYEFARGNKLPVQVTFCEGPDGARRWCIVPMATPRSLYGAERLAARPGATALVVMGEKKADAAQRLLTDLVVVTWAGGDQARGTADLAPLAGRKIMIWPDLDASGFAAAEGDFSGRGEFRPGLAQMLGAAGPAGWSPSSPVRHAAGIRVVQPPSDRAKGWDVGDAIAEGWTADQLRAFLKASVRVARVREPTGEDDRPSPAPATTARAPSPSAPAPPLEPLPASGYVPGQDDGDDQGSPDEADGSSDDPWHNHFRPIGFNETRYYFMPKLGGMLVSFPGGTLDKLGTLLQLVPDKTFWERAYPSKTGADTKTAAAALISACQKRGPYDQTLLRGRGAWLDRERVVVHLGDRLLVDGKRRSLSNFKTKFAYQRAAVFAEPAPDVLPAGQAKMLLDLCANFKWYRPLAGHLLAGWLVIAPICGALNWRPSIWLLAPTGAGKGWIIDNVIKPVIGSWGLFVEGRPTGPGIEQALRSDARPIVWDEAEAEDDRMRQRLKEILFLMRVGSSSRGGVDVKGTQDGQGRQLQIRTCFAFASTNFPVEAAADENRITALRLNPHDSTNAEFASLERSVKATIGASFSAQLLARTISLIPTIRANAETFARAATELWRVRRTGDQIGALLAGAYALHSRKEISIEAALEWLGDKDWSDLAALDRQNEERSCLNHILQHRLKLTNDGNGGSYDLTLGELLMKEIGQGVHMHSSESGQKELLRSGVRVEAWDGSTPKGPGEPPDGTPGFYVSTSHSTLQRALRNTAWGANWKVQLERLPGAVYCGPKTVRFAGTSTRAVWVPVAALEE